MNFLQKKLQEAKANKLKSEVEDLLNNSDRGRNFGSVDPTNDFVINTVVEKNERIRIRPIESVINKGTLLGASKVKPDEPMIKTALSFDDGKLALDNPKTFSVDDLFEYQRVCDKKFLVLDDYIEIIKSTTVSHGESENNEQTKAEVEYKVSHYIEVLDSDSTYRLPTRLYESSPSKSSLGSIPLGGPYVVPETTYTNLDLVEVVEKYKKATLNEIVEPLEVIS